MEEKLKDQNGVTDAGWQNMKLLEMDLLEEVVGKNIVGRASLGVKLIEGAAG